MTEKTRLRNSGSEVFTILNSKGFSYVMDECRLWLDFKIEHIRAYSPEDRDELLQLAKASKALESAVEAYKHS